MLIKLNPIIHSFARQKEDVQLRKLSMEQRIACDRIVVMTLFLVVIVAAVIFS